MTSVLPSGDASADPLPPALRQRCDRPRLRQSLERWANILLDDEARPDLLQGTAQALHAALLQATGMPEAVETGLAHGKALSGPDAANCVLDFQRTACYLRAVDGALRTASTRWPGQVIRVLYAGCGPWAPLLLLLAPRWSDRVSVTLVDVHAQSLCTALDLFAGIGHRQMVDHVECADASTLVVAQDRRPHVLVAEVMQRALAVEPQVAVTAQLAPQLLKDGILVPARVVVRAVLARVADEFATGRARLRIELAPLLTLSAAAADEMNVCAQRLPAHLPEVHVEVPACLPADMSVLLCTRIDVGPGQVLGDYDSGLTQPQILHRIGHAASQRRLMFRYRLGPHPGFEFRCAADAEWSAA